MTSPADGRPPLTDSPWFWLLLFSSIGAISVVVIAPKYATRQRRIEMQYLAHEEVLRRQASGEPRAREPGQEGDAAPPTTAELIIPLWPILMGCGFAMTLACWQLWRTRALGSPDALPREQSPTEPRP